MPDIKKRAQPASERAADSMKKRGTGFEARGLQHRNRSLSLAAEAEAQISASTQLFRMSFLHFCI